MSMGKEVNDERNLALGKVCDSLFYKTGNLGYRVLGELMTMSEKKFENYLSTLENYCKNDNFERVDR